MNTLLALKSLTLIIFINIVNETRNMLMKKITFLYEFALITLSQLVTNSLY